MSDPKADCAKNNKMGEVLTRALTDHGITEISTVFLDDIIVLEKNLPWRVEMAILRLTKDLKILPMFKEKSDDAILNLKVKIIRDIIRPLKYGQYLKELLINCYIIAKHVENISAEEIEEVIIGRAEFFNLFNTPSFGQPIILFDDRSRGAVAYRQLAKEVSGGPPNRPG